MPKRQVIAHEVQVAIFFRDQWLCHWCRKPVIFSPAMKYLEKQIRDSGYEYAPIYFDLHWRRDAAPLLDELGAVLEHRLAHANGGDHNVDNLVTACNKCNGRKSAQQAEAFVDASSFRYVKGRYGEPTAWDGFVSLFMVFSRQYAAELTTQEKKWRTAIESYLASTTGKIADA